MSPLCPVSETGAQRAAPGPVFHCGREHLQHGGVWKLLTMNHSLSEECLRTAGEASLHVQGTSDYDLYETLPCTQLQSTGTVPVVEGKRCAATRGQQKAAISGPVSQTAEHCYLEFFLSFLFFFTEH